MPDLRRAVHFVNTKRQPALEATRVTRSQPLIAALNRWRRLPNTEAG